MFHCAGEALEALCSFLPDAVLMDIQLPGINGLQLTRLLRQADLLELGVQERARWMLIEDGFREGPAGDPARATPGDH